MKGLRSEEIIALARELKARATHPQEKIDFDFIRGRNLAYLDSAALLLERLVRKNRKKK
jgi:hypothetical protein